MNEPLIKLPDPAPIYRMSREELKALAMAVHRAEAFTTIGWSEEQCMRNVPCIFIPARLGAFNHITDPENAGCFFAYTKDAGRQPRSCNGWPVVFACGLLHKDDCKTLCEMLDKIAEAETAMKATL